MPSKENQTISRLLDKAPAAHYKTMNDWNRAKANGSAIYGRPIGFNTRRIYLNAASKYWNNLKPCYSNLYEVVIEAIDACAPEQYSTRKHIGESGISLGKYLISKNAISPEVLDKIRSIKIKRSRQAFRPTRKLKDLEKVLAVNEHLNQSPDNKRLNSILLRFVFWTGLRVSEISDLKLENVLLDDDKILVSNGKGGKDRWVSIHPELKDDLKDYINGRK